jgi:WD40 repeat protein
MTGNPYVGPRSIGPKKQIWGRDREIGELADLVIANRIVLLYAPSGAGKTSLLQAGLLPRLKARRFCARPIVRVGAPVPKGVTLQPPANRYTLSALLALEKQKAGKTPVEILAGMTLDAYLNANPSAEGRELLVFDQLEEALIADPLDVEGREAFFVQLGAALADRSRWAILAMREDILGPLHRYVKYLPTRLSNTYRLDLLKKEAALAAVIGPAAAKGVTFAHDAALKLVENLSAVVVEDEDSTRSGAGEYVEPVQLQVVCRRLWGALAEGTTAIGVEHVASLETVDEALAGYYAQTVRHAARKSGVAESAIRAWVGGSLIAGGQPATRRQVARSDEKTAPVLAALKPLRNYYLIRSDKRLGQIWYELSHDRLIGPVVRDNERNTPELERRAAQWDARRTPALLLHGKEMRRLAADARGATGIVKDFWDESRQRHKTRLILGTLGAVAAAVVAALGVTIYFDSVGLRDREMALASVSLAREAEGRREQRLDLAMLLAVEAWNQAPTNEAFAALYNLVNASPRLVRVLSHDSLVIASVFLPNGSVAVALEGGGLAISSPDGKLVSSAPPQKSSWRTLAVSQDGRLAAGSEDGRVCLLDTVTGAIIAEAPERHNAGVTVLEFDPAGRVLISAEAAFRDIRFWMAREKQLALPLVSDGVPARIQSPDHLSRAALANPFFRRLFTKLVDDSDWKNRFKLSADSAISPDGSVAAVSRGAKIQILDGSGSSLAELRGFHDEAEGFTFSGDSKSLAAHPHFSRSVWIWDLRPPAAELAAIALFQNNRTVWTTSDAKGRQLAIMQEKATGKFILSYLDDARVAVRTELPGRYSGSIRLALRERGGRPLAIFCEDSGRTHIRWADNLSRDISTIDGAVGAVEPNRDGTLLAVSGLGQPRIQLYSVADFSRPVLLTANLTPGGKVEDNYGHVAAFSLVRDVLAIGGPRMTGNGSEERSVVNLWDLTDPNHPLFLGMLALDAQDTASLRFSPDGETLASVDTMVKLWSVPRTPLAGSGRILYPRATLGFHPGAVPGNIRFSPDGYLLAFGERSDTWGSHIHLADAVTGTLLGEPVDVGRPSQVMAFHEKKLELWSYHNNESDEMEGILSVPFDPRGWADTLCRKANRNLSREEWNMFLEDVPYQKTCPARGKAK